MTTFALQRVIEYSYLSKKITQLLTPWCFVYLMLTNVLYGCFNRTLGKTLSFEAGKNKQANILVYLSTVPLLFM